LSLTENVHVFNIQIALAVNTGSVSRELLHPFAAGQILPADPFDTHTLSGALKCTPITCLPFKDLHIFMLRLLCSVRAPFRERKTRRTG